ncbi:uncharacterized protein FOMMEDRAFT_16612 [Fomitiporia mediterranea MF3/22]|uniref:uncharacterized protein n=1 Tax=Fomitiporia mediterranea (strain MF3/22) TaxID=694068 RepID=UPI0004408AC2|nr:uncharacterized protein FOMMEDRAFT_16612 [Fomitiporia mediterranea MF3/22]EJD08140.1 hypothetical protein FOMMEDRAFT_16612 [Fomitiporia mediterranea MF3/22]
MIVLDEDRPDVKGAQPQPHTRNATTDGLSEDSQLVSGSAPPPAYSSTVYDAPLQYPQDVPAHPRSRLIRGENARKRFLRAFVMAICIWILVSILIRSFTVNVDLHRNKNSNHKQTGDENRKPGSDKSDGKDSDWRIRTPRCTLPSQYPSRDGDSSQDAPYSVKIGYSLSVSSNFSFIGNDTYSHGSFIIAAFEEEPSSSNVKVDIVVSYQNPDAVRHSKICFTEEGTDRTIAITRTNDADDLPSNANILRYSVHVRFPVPPREERPLHISRLTANFMLFGIGTTNLNGLVEFDDINLKTDYKNIDAESLTAHRARLETSQAAIKGTYTTSSSLELLTKNGPINVDINMLNPGTNANATTKSATKLTMHTSNAAIKTNVNATSLTTSSSVADSIGGNFTIDSATSYAPLILNLHSQPISSFLSLSARSSSATAEVHLPPQFSGTFNVATSVLRPSLEVSPIPSDEDPARAGRWREVEVTKEEHYRLAGEVTWVDKRGRMERGGGHVDVETSILPAILRL